MNSTMDSAANNTPKTSSINLTDINKRCKARRVVFTSMLLFIFIGAIIMDAHDREYWFYCQLSAGLFALLSLWLFWYTRRKGLPFRHSNFFHHLLHWASTLAIIYLVNLFVNHGIMNTIQAGLMTLTILALALFLIGIYADRVFILIGATLAGFAVASALVNHYLSLIMIPTILFVGFIIYFLLYQDRKKAATQ